MARERLSLDLDWKFKLADTPELSQLHTAWHAVGGCRWAGAGRQTDDSAWRTLDLPHDFVLEREFVPENSLPECGKQLSTAYNGSRPGGVGWYRKRFDLPASDLGRRIYLYFDGVYRDSQVYLNDLFVGAHWSGYTSFYYDVTDFVTYGGENLLAVRVDATQHEGWWYEGGGIYRHVWLVKTGPLHVAPWGTCVSAEVDLRGREPCACLTVRTTLANKTTTPATCRLHTTVLDPDGAPVATAETPLTVPAWGQLEAVQEIAVAPARLWSLETPQLYGLVSEIRQDGHQPVDEYTTPFGIRAIRFDPEQGFFLNEQPVKLKGVCCHQDHAGVGIAIPDRLQEYRLERLKEMGCNGYRCSHHPPTPELLDICDRLGILVMDENRHMSSDPDQLAQLEGMLRRDRNHPSIILWSLGNEEVLIQWKPQSALIARTLKNAIAALDPTRPVTLAICYWNPEGKKDEGFENTPLPAAEVDVMGFNYAPHTWQAYHRARPNQPTVVSEATSSLRTRGCYRSDPEKCHITWDDPKAQPYHEEQWALVAENPYLSGIFLWTGLDYRGEPTPHNWPAISSHFGILDLCGFPKDNFYYYLAWWSDQPVLHLFPHWNWPDRVGQGIKVCAYSNCDEVELFVNGVSAGRKGMPRNGHLEWEDVVYEPGALSATGYRGGREVVAARVETTGAPHGIRLSADRSRIRAGRRDLAVVTVAVVDEQGRLVPTAGDQITFTLEGAGVILGVGNGDPSSHESDKANHRRAFNGLCQVLVQAADDPGAITLTAHSPNLRPASLTVEVTR